MKSLVYYLLVALVLWQAYQHITKVEPASIADSITPTAHVPDAAMAAPTVVRCAHWLKRNFFYSTAQIPKWTVIKMAARANNNLRVGKLS